MLVSLTIRAIDKLSGPALVSKRAIDALGSSEAAAAVKARGAAGAIDALSRSAAAGGGAITGLERDARRLNRMLTDTAYKEEFLRRRTYQLGAAIGGGLRRSVAQGATALGSGMKRGAGQAIGAIAALERRLQVTGENAGWIGTKIGQGIGLGARIGLTAAGAGITAGLYKIVSAGVAQEGYRTQLTGSEGSVAGANKAMGWVSDFAQKTPYELAQVMEAFVQLRAYGIDPIHGALTSLGDAAAGLNKPLMAAVEMIADAQTGEFERLKEFGITGSQAKKGLATFSYINKAGKTATVTVKKDAVTIQKTILGILDARFQGGMDRMSQTTSGKWSNLMDGMTRTAVNVWEHGAGAAVNRGLDRMLSALDRASKDGALDRWADKLGSSLGSLVDTMASANWQQIGKDISDTAGLIGELARNIMAAKTAADQFGRDHPILAHPVASMEQARASVLPKGIWGAYYDAQMTPFRLAGDLLGHGTAAQARKNEAATRRAPAVSLMRPGARLAPAVSLLARPGTQAGPARVGGSIDLRITTDRGVTATPTRLRSNNPAVPISVTRGPVRSAG